VCRFFKDTRVVYVVVDDRLPVRAKDGRPVFAQSKVPSSAPCILHEHDTCLHPPGRPDDDGQTLHRFFFVLLLLLLL
jgi:hypothetical protein